MSLVWRCRSSLGRFGVRDLLACHGNLFLAGCARCVVGVEVESGLGSVALAGLPVYSSVMLYENAVSEVPLTPPGSYSVVGVLPMVRLWLGFYDGLQRERRK